MNKRSVWILNHYAITPDLPGRTRHYELACELINRGYEVTIFASAFSDRTHTQVRLLRGERWANEEVDGVKFVWVPSVAYQGNGWRRMLNMLDFSWRVYWLGRRLPILDAGIAAPGVIIGSATHLFAVSAAWYLSMFYHAHFVMEVRDLWPQSFLDTGQWREGQLRVRFFRRLEQFLYARAERIITLSPLTRDYLARYSQAWAHKVVYIPNGTRVARFAQAAEDRRPSSSPLTVMYLGAMGVTNGLEVVLEAIRLVNQADPHLLQVTFVGDGPEKPRLRQLARQMGLHNVLFEDPVSNTEVPRVAGRADMFILVQREILYGSLTKLYDYMAAARPIVCAVYADHNNPIEQTGCGLSASPDSPQDLADKMSALAHMPEAERQAMGERGRAFVQKHHDYSVLGLRLNGMLEELQTKALCDSPPEDGQI
ncbi:MAG: glycosyltransferase family 4 protein [Chloroflexi bacterium]|nr:glycosyltransferase family 4 protein [Chloroflexota bacterium]